MVKLKCISMLIFVSCLILCFVSCNGKEHVDTTESVVYNVTSVKIGDKEIDGYKIAIDTSNEGHRTAATKLQNYLYENAGYRLDIVDIKNADSKSIFIKTVTKGNAGDFGFRGRIDGESYILECAHDNRFTEAFDVYYNSVFENVKGDLNLGEYDSSLDITRYSYKDFGAVGDGKTNDVEAIRKTHLAANRGGQTVYAEQGATYYLPPFESGIVISTDVDWNGAKFIFDDTKIDVRVKGAMRNAVFIISSDEQPVVLSADSNEYIQALNVAKEDGEPVIKGIQHGANKTQKLDLGLGYPALLKVTNKTSYAYLRWGYTDPSGREQTEVVHVDAEGNIDPDTPFLLDYDEITEIIVYRTDVTPITIENATVESKASCINLEGSYATIYRQIAVERPNVTLKNIVHEITGEIGSGAPVKVDEDGVSYDVSSDGFTINSGKVYKDGVEYTKGDVKPFTGHSYSGFLNIRNAHNILVKDVTFQARRYYKEGTYDISAGYSNKIIFEDCIQSNFFDPGPKRKGWPNMWDCWGVAGTSYCKNLEYINCELTRYDAHEGVYNGKIVGGKLAILRLIGGGTFLLEDVDIYSNSNYPIQLREDFGATFNGTLIVRDVHFVDYQDDDIYWGLIKAPSANWDFGFKTYFPNLILDNITVDTNRTEFPIVASVNDTPYEDGNRYPERNPILDNVHDPDARFDSFYTTKYQFDEKGEFILDAKGNKIPFTDGKVYTIHKKDDVNLNPYTPPESIKVMSQCTAITSTGERKDLKLTLYDCDFFEETVLEGTSSWVERVAPPGD